MINENILGQTTVESPLQAASHLVPKENGKKRVSVTTVMLTPLVDAFSILVIYLLVSFSSSGEMITISKDMELPAASKAEVLQRSTIVKLESNKIYIENEEVSQKSLVSRLIELKKQFEERKVQVKDDPALIVQADRRTKYESINQVVLAGSQSGFSEIKFAVLTK